MRVYPKHNRIAVEFAYNPLYVKAVKRIPGRQYHPRGRYWTFPLDQVEAVRDLVELGFKVDQKLYEEIQAEREKKAKLTDMAVKEDAVFESSLPLFPYQRAGCAFLKEAGSALLADEMGLGKTIQSLAVVDHVDAEKVLIICPSALKYQWESEIEKFLPGEYEVVVIDGTKPQRIKQWANLRETNYWGEGEKVQKQIFIMNYELLLRDDFDHASKVKWQYILADEATKISNPQAKTSKRIKKLDADHRIAMTGTPISNRANEIWNLIDWIYPGSLGTYWTFLQRYCVKNDWGSIIYYKNMDELRDRVRPYMLRRLKEEVLTELPEKILTDIPVKLSPKEKKLYDQIREEILYEIEEPQIDKLETPSTIQYTLVKMTRLMQLTSSLELLGSETTSSKLDTLKELMSEVPEDDKMIVFTRFSKMTDILMRELSDYNPVRIIGDTKTRDRQGVVNAFNDDPKHRVLLMTSAGQFGLNIQAANVLFHYDLEWSIAKMEQREGRAHRLGQAKQVMVYNLLARSTLDTYVRRVLHQKRKTSKALLDTQPTIDQDTIKEMLNYDQD